MAANLTQVKSRLVEDSQQVPVFRWVSIPMLDYKCSRNTATTLNVCHPDRCGTYTVSILCILETSLQLHATTSTKHSENLLSHMLTITINWPEKR